MKKKKKSKKNIFKYRLVLLNKKRDKKANKNKKKSEILDKYKLEIEKDLKIDDKPTYNLLKEKKVTNKEKAVPIHEKSLKLSKVFQKYRNKYIYYNTHSIFLDFF